MLILLRGNSGSGKSTTAKLLRDKILEQETTRKVAVIEQDYLRRILLKEKELGGGDNVELIYQVASFALQRGYTVILEGILNKQRYGTMIDRLLKQSDKNLVCYFDVSFEETVRRHKLKPNVDEFGEKEMRQWYTPHDVLGIENEVIIDDTLSQDQVIQQILRDVELL